MQMFAEALTPCHRIDPRTWVQSRTFWKKLKERWAYFILARINPYIARHQMRTLQ